MKCWFFWLSLMVGFGIVTFPQFGQAAAPGTCRLDLIVLGTAQDAGKPQIGHDEDPAWKDPAQAEPASAIAIVDHARGTRYLFDATPDIKKQLYALDQTANSSGFRLDGIFLTHAHIGHYLGLAQLGREAMGAKAIPVYAMPAMQSFLTNNGPWSLLIRLKNIALMPLTGGHTFPLESGLRITPFLVPHRAEYTETVGYRIQGKSKNVIYLPDIDSWAQWDEMGTHLEDIIANNDVLYLDATFYSGDELPGRDMSKIPHPTISHTMKRLKPLAAAQKAKIRFIHLNHSNPAHDPTSEASKTIHKAGFNVAQTGERVCLD